MITGLLQDPEYASLAASLSPTPMRRLVYAFLLGLLPSATSAQVLPFVPPLTPDSTLLLRARADSMARSVGTAGLLRVQPRLDSLRTRANRIQEASFGKPILSLIGSGGLKGFQPADTTSQASASGAIGLRLITSYAQYTALVNVVAQDPEVTNNFAGALLTPGTGTRGVVLDFQRGKNAATYTGSNSPPRRWGWHLLGAMSSAKWRSGDASRNVIALSASGRWTTDLFRAVDTTAKQGVLDYGLRFDVGPSLRYLAVDGTAPAGFRKAVLGSRQAVYGGVESGLTLLVGNFLATARLTFFPDFGLGTVDGLTGLRFTSGIALQADLARLPVRFR
ncbi:MAG: hypothetical protein ACK42I_09140 [Thermomicrobium sp.]